MKHWSGLRPLTSVTLSCTLTETSMLFPAVAQSWKSWDFGSVGPTPSLTLIAHKPVDVGVDQLKTQDSGLRGSQVG